MSAGCVGVGQSELTLDNSQTCILMADLLTLDQAVTGTTDEAALQASIDELKEMAERLGDDLQGPVEAIAGAGIDPEDERVKEAQQSLRLWAESNCVDPSVDSDRSPDEGTGDLRDSEQLRSPGSRPDLEPALQVLADACLGGTLDACDDLWLWSDSESEMERLAATCGDRSETRYSGSCSASFDSDLTDDSLNREQGDDEAAIDLGTDPGFDVLVAACRAASEEDVSVRNAACELLYLNAPTDSQYELEAQLCGGRSAQLVFQPCSEIE
jgi:hypothetical protein